MNKRVKNMYKMDQNGVPLPDFGSWSSVSLQEWTEHLHSLPSRWWVKELERHPESKKSHQSSHLQFWSVTTWNLSLQTSHQKETKECTTKRKEADKNGWKTRMRSWSSCTGGCTLLSRCFEDVALRSWDLTSNVADTSENLSNYKKKWLIYPPSFLSNHCAAGAIWLGCRHIFHCPIVAKLLHHLMTKKIKRFKRLLSISSPGSAVRDHYGEIDLLIKFAAPFTLCWQDTQIVGTDRYFQEWFPSSVLAIKPL